MKVLVAIVSYQAEEHIADVIARLPGEIWNNDRFHVLLSDDASTDRTVEVAQRELEYILKI